VCCDTRMKQGPLATSPTAACEGATARPSTARAPLLSYYCGGRPGCGVLKRLSGRQARTAARSAAAPPPHSHSRTNEPETQRQSLKRQRHKHTESCADVLRHRGTCEAGAAACHAPSWGKAAAQQQRGRRPHGAVHTAHCVRLIAASLPAEMVRRFDSGSILICYTKERRWDWLARLRAPAVRAAFASPYRSRKYQERG